MIVRHGGGLYVVRERGGEPSFEEQYAIFDDLGRVSDEDAVYVWERGRIEFRSGRFGPEASRPVFPYDRYFGSAAAERPHEEAVCKLGQALRIVAWDQPVSVSEIPAAFTYLGQFIFHDLTHMVGGDDKPLNQRSAVLDLDSLFDAYPGCSTFAPCQPQPPTHLPLGCTGDGAPLDIPRATSGEPYLGERRSDDNLALAQTHMAMIRFANAVADNSGDSYEAKRLVQLHFQSVVLHDYLARIIDHRVYRDVMENGRAVIAPAGRPRGDGDRFLLPLEFAAAAGRFGHSMIRSRYAWTSVHPVASLYAFWEQTYNSGDPRAIRVSPRWRADWRRLLAIDHSSPIWAACISTRLSSPLDRIPLVALPESQPRGSPREQNLAVRSLLRGVKLELASGQSVVRAVNSVLRAQTRSEVVPLGPDELVINESEEVRDLMLFSPGDGLASLATDTPLWFYILKEAEVRNCGLKLGPLGARIVMESLHAAIEFADPSIIDPDGRVRWLPDPCLEPSGTTEYSLMDLLKFARLL